MLQENTDTVLQKRFTSVFNLLTSNDPVSALSLIFNLVEGAGAKIYGGENKGERFRKVLIENQDFIYWAMSFGQIRGQYLEIQLNFKGTPYSVPYLLWRIARNPLIHGAEFDGDFEINETSALSAENGIISLPVGIVWGLAFMLTYLSCYQNECPSNTTIGIRGKIFKLSEFWGSEEKVRKFLSENLFSNPG